MGDPAARFDLDRIGAGLPFAAAVGDLEDALSAGAVVIEAPPGTGKTTLVPPVVANAVPGRVVLTQPRRIAAGAAARRLASLTGTRVGDLVGITIRGRHEVGPATRIEIVTPGVLLRRLIGDPALTGVDAVVLDEVHERGLDTDLLVGMLAEVRALRDDLTLVAMSATLDDRLADVLGARVVRAEHVLHPLEVDWAPPPGPFADTRGLARDFVDHVVAVTLDAWERTPAAGDALVFMPAVADVEHVARGLRPRLPGVDVLELHGRLPLADQDRVTAGRGEGDPPRVVVTTALAESSLTVPGVRLVVDAGLSREPRRDAARAMSGLVTVRCSRDAAIQRAGRAAREGPGRVVRCYDRHTFGAMPAHVTPEVAVADLTAAALTLAAWGAPAGVGLPLPDPLSGPALTDALRILTDLGAIDDDGRITDEGRRLVALPTDPRLARALLAPEVGTAAAAEVVAMLGDDLRPEGADLERLLTALRSGRHPAVGRWRRERDRLRRIASGIADPSSAPDGHTPVGAVVALAQPGWIARRSGESYLLATGTRAALPPGSSLAGHAWLAVADVARAQGRATADSGAMIRAAAPLTEDGALRAGSHLVADEERCLLDGGKVVARRIRRLGAIELSTTPTPPSPAAVEALWREVLQRDGIDVLRPSRAGVAFRRRLAFLHHHLGAPWPDVSDAALAAAPESWFDLTVTRVDAVDLAVRLQALLPWPQAARLDELAPTHLVLAGGTRARVEYPVDPSAERPVVAVRLQACFGQVRTPVLADGRAPVVFHLLSPAGRPLAITDDLASFWAGPYAHVRAEMRGRYPKHAWPQDPSREHP
ncbi:ATP-dependent helicase HrpB [Mobilicoccus caccae]|uniref:ATP-dependent helicase HrpB n=1 Tax=Mobilicoccus caccae TaxID=1859295 RepID=A0ABQ6J018_9MICO|nr:ATP-dependent helicase HrpB [Mobilicoccus caccae]GMA42303.1 ATP-dependent helicase HrpB [Mobilicoccus caccae]